MSGNQQTPQGGHGNIYDAQFADRIANISRGGGGGGGGKKPGGGSRGGWGTVGGVAVVLFILLRVVLAGSRGCSDRDRPSYTYIHTPPAVEFQRPPEEGWERAMQERDIVRLAGLMERQRRESHLTADDIVFAPGLCREIVEDTEEPGRPPGKRLYDRLDEAGKELVRRLASSREANPADTSALVAKLDDVLGSPDFYDVTTFRAVPRPELEDDLAALWDGLRRPATDAEVRSLNRAALGAAYPGHLFSLVRSLEGRGVGLPELRRLRQQEHEEALRVKGQ